MWEELSMARDPSPRRNLAREIHEGISRWDPRDSSDHEGDPRRDPSLCHIYTQMIYTVERRCLGVCLFKAITCITVGVQNNEMEMTFTIKHLLFEQQIAFYCVSVLYHKETSLFYKIGDFMSRWKQEVGQGKVIKFRPCIDFFNKKKRFSNVN